MVAILHMAMLTSWCSSSIWKIAGLFGKITAPMLGTGPHFPLGMIVTHMTLLTCPWVEGFFFEKGMPCMAFVARIILVTVALVAKFFFLRLRLYAHIVASATTTTAFYELIRGGMGSRQCI